MPCIRSSVHWRRYLNRQNWKSRRVQHHIWALAIQEAHHRQRQIRRLGRIPYLPFLRTPLRVLVPRSPKTILLQSNLNPTHGRNLGGGEIKVGRVLQANPRLLDQRHSSRGNGMSAKRRYRNNWFRLMAMCTTTNIGEIVFEITAMKSTQTTCMLLT